MEVARIVNLAFGLTAITDGPLEFRTETNSA